LPRDIATFTGRQVEFAQLMGTLAAAAPPGGVVRIYAIDGMAGVGKTALAVHAAHRPGAVRTTDEDASAATIQDDPVCGQ